MSHFLLPGCTIAVAVLMSLNKAKQRSLSSILCILVVLWKLFKFTNIKSFVIRLAEISKNAIICKIFTILLKSYYSNWIALKWATYLKYSFKSNWLLNWVEVFKFWPDDRLFCHKKCGNGYQYFSLKIAHKIYFFTLYIKTIPNLVAYIAAHQLEKLEKINWWKKGHRWEMLAMQAVFL